MACQEEERVEELYFPEGFTEVDDYIMPFQTFFNATKGIETRYKEINEANIDSILQEEIGKVFEQVLEDAGVYKCDEDGLRAFLRFIAEVNS